MNIFTVDKNWISGLGDLGPVGTLIARFLGPILTFAFAVLFLAILIKNVIPLMKKDTPPQEKEAARHALVWWGIGVAIILAGVAIVTGIFFGFGRRVQEASQGGAAKQASMALNLIYDHLKGINTL